VRRPFWLDDRYVVYNSCWFSPAQSFSGPNPPGLMTIFCCLRFETLPTWRPHIYIPQEQSGPVIPPGTRFPFRRLLRLAGLRWMHSNPPPHRFINKEILVRTIHLLSFDATRTVQKTTPPTVLCCHGNFFTESLPSNDKGIHTNRPTYSHLIRHGPQRK
jgi:hypothetical protein